MISVITGSDGIGKYLENANNDVIKVVQGVESMNSAAVYPQLKGMDFLNTFIRSVEGVEGHQEGFREYQVFASDDGSYADAEYYKESYATWTFNRRGYVVKDKDFTHEMLKMAYEENKSLSKIVDERISAIADMYLNRYLPNVAYETLFVVPEEGGTYYGTPVGFLRGTVVSPSMLKPYAQSAEHLVRNHYRTIANGTTGVTADDISDVVDFMSEYRNVTDGNIVAIGNRRAIGKLKNTILFDGNRDVFNR